MSTQDERLAALLRADRPAARDGAFRVAVLERAARRRLWRRLALVLAAGGLATAGVALISPQLATEAELIAADGGLLALGLGIAATATIWSLRQMRRPL